MKRRLKGRRERDFDIGDMDKLMYLQKEVSVPDDIGGREITWTDGVPIWCKVMSVKNDWLQEMDMRRTADYVGFITRYDSAIKKTMSLFDTETNILYRIVDIEDYNKKKWYMKLNCEGNVING